MCLIQSQENMPHSSLHSSFSYQPNTPGANDIHRSDPNWKQATTTVLPGKMERERRPPCQSGKALLAFILLIFLSLMWWVVFSSNHVFSKSICFLIDVATGQPMGLSATEEIYSWGVLDPIGYSLIWFCINISIKSCPHCSFFWPGTGVRSPL